MAFGVGTNALAVQFEQVKRILPALLQQLADDPTRAPQPQPSQPLPTADVAMSDASGGGGGNSTS